MSRSMHRDARRAGASSRRSSVLGERAEHAHAAAAPARMPALRAPRRPRSRTVLAVVPIETSTTSASSIRYGTTASAGRRPKCALERVLDLARRPPARAPSPPGAACGAISVSCGKSSPPTTRGLSVTRCGRSSGGRNASTVSWSGMSVMHHRVRQHERVLAHHHRQQHARVLGEAVGQQDRVEHLLVVLAVELDPAGVAQHQRVAVVDPDVPRRAERAVDRHHHDRQPEVARREHVLRHVGEPVRRRRRERARAGERRSRCTPPSRCARSRRARRRPSRSSALQSSSMHSVCGVIG